MMLLAGIGLHEAMMAQNILLKETRSYGRMLKKHPITKVLKAQRKEYIRKGELPETPDKAWAQDWLWTMNPELGRPTPELLPGILERMKAEQNTLMGLPGSTDAAWIARGPSNVGGRTRALAWDPNDPSGKKVWAGGVTGGLWYNTDISNGNVSWQAVGDFWDNTAITCIAFDPNDTKIMYVGTGEGWQVGSSRGAGIWKSTDAGTTWTQLASTKSFFYVNDIVVRNESGTSVVYAAIDGMYYMAAWHGEANAGIQRSANGGSSWTNVSPTVPSTSYKFTVADLEIAKDNRIWAGTRKSPYGNTTEAGGGRILTSQNGTTWTIVYSSAATKTGRVAIACAPSDSAYAYAMVEHNNVCQEIVRSTNVGTTWTACAEPVDVDNGIPDTDFTRGQAWYDFVISVDPNNRSRLVCGGIDLFISTNGGAGWSHISKWSNNANLNTLNCSYVHADQHAIVFKPKRSDTLIIGCDGGVFYTPKLSSATTSNVIAERTKDYMTIQFYAAAQSPAKASNILMGGAQDNGTVQTSSAGISDAIGITGGDGGYCFIDQSAVATQISSYVYNQFYITSNSWNTNTQFLNDATTGSFINPCDYDDNLNVFFSAKSEGSLYRVKGLPASPVTTSHTYATGTPGKISTIKVSPNGGTNGVVFLGTETGRIYKMAAATTTTPVFTLISSTLPGSRTVSCIDVGGSDDTLLVCYSNYGLVNSVFYSTNGGTTWANKDNSTLPDFPVRWALFNPANRKEVILATELGIWGTQDISLASPVWKSMNNGMPNVRVNMLKVRSSDLQVVAATYGRGYYTSDGFNSFPPRVKFGVSSTDVCLNSTLNLYDSSENKPTGWNWSFTPSSVVFVSGTDSSSKNPVVRFLKSGTYSVTLEASNGNGFGTKTSANLIAVSDTIIPTVKVSLAKNPICPGEQAVYIYTAVNEGSVPKRMWYLNGFVSGNSGPSYVRNSPSNGEKVYMTLVSNVRCASTVPVYSDTATLTINPIPSAAVVDRKGDTLFSKTAADSFWWYLNGSRIAGTAQKIKSAGGGNYSVKIWKGGCISAFSNESQWWPAALGTLKTPSWKLYPSPVNGKACVLESDNDLLVVAVCDAQGRGIALEVQQISPRRFIINTSGLTSGNYILHAHGASGTESGIFQVVK